MAGGKNERWPGSGEGGFLQTCCLSIVYKQVAKFRGGPSEVLIRLYIYMYIVLPETPPRLSLHVI